MYDSAHMMMVKTCKLTLFGLALQASHLLKYDSMLGTFAADVKAGDNSIIVDGIEIKVVSDRNPLNLPWKYVSLP